MNYFPSGTGYGQTNFKEFCRRKVRVPPGWRRARKHRQMEHSQPLAQNCAHSRAWDSIKCSILVLLLRCPICCPWMLSSSITQINHHYRRIPFHSRVTAEITRDIINILKAHTAQDISGQIINQINFNTPWTVHYIRTRVLIWILSFFF